MMNVVFTGTAKLNGKHIVRRVLEKRAEQKGYRVQHTVDSSTDFVVVGDTGRHGFTSKVKSALSKGVKVIGVEQFMEMVES